jgi:hypothetical protein
MARKYRPWSRAEYDQLETLLNQGLSYAATAETMGRERISVQGAAQRIGIMSPERRRWRVRRDWPEIDALLEECIETRLMTMPQAHAHIAALGYSVSKSALYGRLSNHYSLKMRARANSQRRMTAVCRRVHAAQTASARRVLN